MATKFVECAKGQLQLVGNPAAVELNEPSAPVALLVPAAAGYLTLSAHSPSVSLTAALVPVELHGVMVRALATVTLPTSTYAAQMGRKQV